MVDGNHPARQIISVEVIPHEKMRYETCGDYTFGEDGSIHVKVSAMGNRDCEFLVAIHELVEAYLCQKRGITDEVITGFDIGFEENRQPGDIFEPGDHPQSPYRDEHCLATSVERMMCAALGVSWWDYEDACRSLFVR